MISIDDFVTGGTGIVTDPFVGWDSIAWATGETYEFGKGFYGFASLPISVPVTLQGSGGSAVNSDFFGGAWLNGSNFGTVLLSTAVAGSAITLNHPDNSYAYNLRDLMVLGPGSGIAIGVSLGSLRAAVQCRWDNVYIANFFQGFEFDGVMDSTFTHLRVNGCVTGGVIGLNSNQNVYNNLQAQHGTVGFKFVNNSQNRINGGLIQNVATGIIVSSTSLSIAGLYGEAFATLVKIDSTLGGVKNLTVRDIYASGGTLIGTVGMNGVNYFTLENVTWGSGSLTIPNHFTNAFIRNAEATALVDQGVNTTVLDPALGIKIPKMTNPLRVAVNHNNIAPIIVTDTAPGGHTWYVGAVQAVDTFDFRDITAPGAPIRASFKGG